MSFIIHVTRRTESWIGTLCHYFWFSLWDTLIGLWGIQSLLRFPKKTRIFSISPSTGKGGFVQRNLHISRTQDWVWETTPLFYTGPRSIQVHRGWISTEIQDQKERKLHIYTSFQYKGQKSRLNPRTGP